MMSLKSSEDTIRFNAKKVMKMETGPLMLRYNPNIDPFKNYCQMKATFYIYPMYEKLPSLLVNKLLHVFTTRELIFVAPIKSKAYGGIGLMDLCDEHDIP